MTNLSVNINKVALIRNARKGNYPDLFKFAKDCEEYGAQGITVHPRPDQRHIRYSDIPILKAQTETEFNIEGNPTEEFMNLVLKNKPDQCTLVPDSPDVLTSDQGWDTITNQDFLTEITKRLQGEGIRVSIFVDPIEEMIMRVKDIGAERIEIYTGDFAKDPDGKVYEQHVKAANVARNLDIGVNAGHDLNLDNLAKYISKISFIKEVSIGHAIISDAIYYGIQNTISMYLRRLK